MPFKWFQTEDIIQKLRETDVLLSQGQNVADSSRQVGVTGQVYCHLQKDYGGVRTNQAKRLKELDRENADNAIY